MTTKLSEKNILIDAMENELKKIIMRMGLASTVLLLTVGCVSEPLPKTMEGFPHRIEVPSPTARIATELNPTALPEGASAHLPAYDGDRFFVTLPVAQQNSVTAKQVLQDVVVPILKAIGFERGGDALLSPPEYGVKIPTANFNELAQDVALEYQKNKKLFRPKSQKIIDASLRKTDADSEVDRALQVGEGMTFSQLVAEIERQEIQFPFQQVVDGVPIEHTLILASRWEGQSVRSVRGVVYNKYTITNQNKKDSERSVEKAIKALLTVEGVDKVDTAVDGPHRVLLPYGTDPTGKTILRYSDRMILRTVFQKEDGKFLLWLDAETGKILKLEPLFDNAQAEGMEFLRDPSTGGTFKATFKVDPATGGQYVLQKQGLSNRVDYLGDGDPANDLAIPENSNGSTPYFANFAQAPINDAAEAICSSGNNKEFQQVNFLAALHFYSKHIFNLGIFMPFPKLGGTSSDSSDPWDPQIEVAGYCNAHSSMKFGACDGYFDAACPSVGQLNMAHDKTMIAHELGHTITPRLTLARPSDWCGVGTCAVPLGWFGLHDLADVWADYFESTNCTGGWVYKNQGGVDNSLNCLNHNEFGYLPRLHEVTVPFDPAQPGDHFPEKPIQSGLYGGFYGNAQTAAAALWHVRLGMRSKSRSFGAIQYGIRLTRALMNTGFTGTADASKHDGLYKSLYDLELEMVDQWTHSATPGVSPALQHKGPHTTNKVTAGFARAGLFLIPPQCLDGDKTTGAPRYCPTAKGGENGGDAVIDITDNDSADDIAFAGVVHPEEDYLELGGRAPTFHVWTGSRYRLDGANGDPTFNNPAPCNSVFRVEVSTDETFATGSTFTSHWMRVDTDPTTPSSPECYGTWTPTDAQWNSLQTNGALSFIYYRARTQNDTKTNRRLSTRPGRLWQVPPPYAVITTDGESEY